ncbi:MAG: hypothetical protein N2504_00625 [candidate division WOR-3 bacterium]|nr:hypothetical protein [candidate division WOR-3 bacterium]MCX7947078.1 hypothetical protein [candidate division WOR-3 bacterium]MDW8149881.1 hypothetical protein [candidate division WOR-3 bacterium]
MIFITFLYEVRIINGTENKPVDSAISFVFKIENNEINLIDSFKVKNGILKFDIKDSSVKTIGIQTIYEGYSFYSPIITLPIKNETLFVYDVSNEGSYKYSEYGAFVVNQDSTIVIAENIVLSTNSKKVLIPNEPIKIHLPKNYSDLQYNGFPNDSVQVVGDTLIIKPFLIPNTNNVISFVYITHKRFKLSRNFGNINYTVAIRKDLKHSIKNLKKGDIQKMGGIDIQVYNGNKPPVIEAGVIPHFNFFEVINKNRYVVAGIFVVVIVLVILFLQSRKKGETNSKESQQEDKQ